MKEVSRVNMETLKNAPDGDPMWKKAGKESILLKFVLRSGRSVKI